MVKGTVTCGRLVSSLGAGYLSMYISMDELLTNNVLFVLSEG